MTTTTPRFSPRADAMFRAAWDMGASLLYENYDGTVDWF